MVTIVAHTTRATGTVLTASIYNADHQNHITNASTINATAAYVDVANSFTGNQTINKSAAILTLKGTGNSSIEIGRVDGTASTPTIEFHSGVTLTDYDSRLIASGGTGSDGGGSLQVVTADFIVSKLTATQLSYSTSLLIGDGGAEDFRFNADGFLSNGLTVTKTAINDAGTGLSLQKAGIVWISRAGAAGGYVNRDTTDGIAIKFGRKKVAVGSISVTAAATAYNTSSDARLKENMRAIDPSIVDQIKVYDFAWKHDNSRGYGCTAQELEVLLPHVVFKGDKPETDMWSVDYSKLVPLLIAKCQDLEKRLAALEARM